MYRRHLILGIAILGTGCISIGNAPESATQTANTDSSPTPSASSTPISTSDVIIRSALRYAVATDSMTVEAPERAQFAFVRPPDDDSERPLDAYELVVGDRQFSPRSSVGGRIRGGSGLAVPGSQTNINQAYTADNRSGWLVFDVPNVDADTGALRRGESNFSRSPCRTPPQLLKISQSLSRLRTKAAATGCFSQSFSNPASHTRLTFPSKLVKPGRNRCC